MALNINLKQIDRLNSEAPVECDDIDNLCVLPTGRNKPGLEGAVRQKVRASILVRNCGLMQLNLPLKPIQLDVLLKQRKVVAIRLKRNNPAGHREDATRLPPYTVL